MNLHFLYFFFFFCTSNNVPTCFIIVYEKFRINFNLTSFLLDFKSWFINHAISTSWFFSNYFICHYYFFWTKIIVWFLQLCMFYNDGNMFLILFNNFFKLSYPNSYSLLGRLSVKDFLVDFSVDSLDSLTFHLIY